MVLDNSHPTQIKQWRYGRTIPNSVVLSLNCLAVQHLVQVGYFKELEEYLEQYNLLIYLGESNPNQQLCFKRSGLPEPQFGKLDMAQVPAIVAGFMRYTLAEAYPFDELAVR